jgi:multidrug transporter EmrE-like cation transporter
VRSTKFRQAAFVYLHVAILSEVAAYVMWRAGRLPHTSWGPPTLWLVLGGVVSGLVFLGLLHWQNVPFARVIWAVHGLRLPTLVHGAFFPDLGAIPPSFYITAIVVVMINLWMLARAAWDL